MCGSLLPWLFTSALKLINYNYPKTQWSISYSSPSWSSHVIEGYSTRNTRESMVHGANMGSIWGRQDPGGPYVSLMNLAILEIFVHTYNYPNRQIIADAETYFWTQRDQTLSTTVSFCAVLATCAMRLCVWKYPYCLIMFELLSDI